MRLQTPLGSDFLHLRIRYNVHFGEFQDARQDR